MDGWDGEGESLCASVCVCVCASVRLCVHACACIDCREREKTERRDVTHMIIHYVRHDKIAEVDGMMSDLRCIPVVVTEEHKTHHKSTIRFNMSLGILHYNNASVEDITCTSRLVKQTFSQFGPNMNSAVAHVLCIR